MKTLIHIIPTLENGGAETLLTRLVEEFSKEGVKQIVISIQGDENDFNYHRVVQFSSVIHAKDRIASVKEIFQQNPEASILAWMYKGILRSHQWKRNFKTQQNIIWNIRRSSFRPKEIYQKTSLYFFGLFSKIARTPIIYCAYQAEKTHNKYGFYSSKSIVIQNRLAKKLVFENTQNPFTKGAYILYVGRYNRAKGPDRLLEIAEILLPKNPKYSLLIAGDGWDSDTIPYKLKKQVVLLGNVKDMAPLYKYATALLFTSYTEGYPNVLVEAAVCGTPIIGFSAGDSPYILEDYSLGSLVISQSSFCTQLQQLMENSVSLKEREDIAKVTIARFNFKETFREYKNFIFP